MSWDVVVQNFEGHPPPEDEMVEGLPLGTAASIRKKIDKYLPGVNWSDPLTGFYEEEAFSIEFQLGEEQPITCMVLAVRGGGEAFAALKSFARPHKWSLFDCTESAFLDLDSPTASGFEAFQNYRDRAIAQKNRRPKSPAKAKKRKQSPPKKKAARTPAKRKRKKP
jgi:hypothetical protein